MNADRFDALTRVARHARSRRDVLRVAVGGAFAIVAGSGTGMASARQATPDAGSPATPCPATAAADSEAIARAYFDAFNMRDADALGALLADDYAHQGALVTQQDKALHQQRLLALHESFPDLHYTLEAVIPEGDLVAVRHTFTATHLGEFQGLAPTGNPVAIGGIHIHRIACGKIVETWNSGDALGLLQQVGLLPGGVLAPAATPPASAASPSADCPATTVEKNRALVRRWFDDAVNPRSLAVFGEILAADIMHHAAGFPDTVGPDPIAAGLFGVLFVGFPDLQFVAEPGPAAGDLVVERWTATGTHTGEFQGIAPTSTSASWTGINIYRIACGEIVELWTEADTLGRLRQIGGAPGPGTPAPAS